MYFARATSSVAQLPTVEVDEKEQMSKERNGSEAGKKAG
jgi:hypothetical protein